MFQPLPLCSPTHPVATMSTVPTALQLQEEGTPPTKQPLTLSNRSDWRRAWALTRRYVDATLIGSHAHARGCDVCDVCDVQVEEELFEGGEIDMGDVKYNWSDKYRPRKPR